MKDIQSNLTELMSHLEKTNEDLAEIDNTMLRKVKSSFLKDVLLWVLGITGWKNVDERLKWASIRDNKDNNNLGNFWDTG